MPAPRLRLSSRIVLVAAAVAAIGLGWEIPRRRWLSSWEHLE
jgi:hypothetical protein